MASPPPSASPRAARLRALIRSPHAAPLGLLTAALAALLAPTFRMYMWHGHERFHAVGRVRELCRLWAEQGPFHAPWLPDVCFGQGWPFFTFYAPLGYYVAAAFHFLFGLSYGAATRWSFYASLGLGALLMYALAWRLAEGSPRRRGWALAAAVVYTFAPYHLTDIFARVSLAESWVWAVLPGLFLALETARRRTLAGILWIGLTTGALVLSHNVLALYGVLLVGLYTVLTARDRRWPLAVAAGGGLGLALSAYFWLPALALKSLVPVQDINFMYGSPDFLRTHAVHWQQFFIERLGKGESLPGWRDQLGIDLGIAVGVALVLAAAALVRKGVEPFRRRRLAVLLGLGALFLFATTPAMPWQYAPGLLRYVQFPWRLLLLTTFLGVLALATAAPALGRRVPPAALTVLALLLGLGGAYRSLFADVPPMSDAELPRWIAAEERDYVFAGCQKVEYRPLTARRHLTNYRFHEDFPPAPSRLARLSGNLTLKGALHRGTSYYFDYAAPEEATVMVQVFHFPGWALRIDGRRAARRLGLEPETGYVRLRLPAGEHMAELKYELSPVGRTARWISVAGWGTLLGVAAVGWRRKRLRAPPQ